MGVSLLKSLSLAYQLDQKVPDGEISALQGEDLKVLHHLKDVIKMKDDRKRLRWRGGLTDC